MTTDPCPAPGGQRRSRWMHRGAQVSCCLLLVAGIAAQIEWTQRSTPAAPPPQAHVLLAHDASRRDPGDRAPGADEELQAKPDRYLDPGLGVGLTGGPCMELPDPFGNTLRIEDMRQCESSVPHDPRGSNVARDGAVRDIESHAQVLLRADADVVGHFTAAHYG